MIGCDVCQRVGAVPEEATGPGEEISCPCPQARRELSASDRIYSIYILTSIATQ